MKRRTPFAAITALFTLLHAGADAPAEEPPKPSAAASAAASATASAAASATASATATPEGKSFADDPPGTDKTKAPTADEWKTAAPVALTRGVSACRSYRVREWLKIHCDGFPAAGVSLLAGPQEGVMVWVDQASEGSGEAMKKPRAAEVIFPVRRGDGRMVQIAQFGEGYDGPLGWNLAFTVSEQWAPGEEAPVITIW